MSAEKLYQSVKSGKVKMDDLNEEGKNALRQYMGISTKPSHEMTLSQKELTQKLIPSTLSDPMKNTQARLSKQSKPNGNKVINTIKNIGHGLTDFETKFRDITSIGLDPFLRKKIAESGVLPEKQAQNELHLLDRAESSVGGKIGEIAGYIMPGTAIEKGVGMLAKPVISSLPKLGQQSITLGTAGAIEVAAQEGGDVAFRGKSFDPENIAIGGAIGGALPSVGVGVKSSIKKLREGAKALKTQLNESPNMGISAFAKKSDHFTNPKDTRSHIVSKTSKDPVSLLDATNEAYIKGVDSLQRINQIDKYVESVSGKKLNPKDRTYMLALNSKGSDMIARTNLIENLVDSQGNVIGDSLKAISSRLPKDKTIEFEDYLIAQHAVTRMTRGEKVYSKKMNMTPEKAADLALQYEQKFPGFKELGEQFRAYSDKLGKAWLVDTGMIPESAWNKWKQENPFWVPNQRKFADIEKVSGGKAKGGFANQSSPVKAYGEGGSERPIISPFETMIEYTDKYVKTAKRNEVMQSLYRNVSDNPEAFKGFAEVIGAVNKADDITKGTLDIDDIINRFSDEFEAAIQKPDLTKGNVVRVMVDGKPVHMKIHDPQFLEALTTLSPQATNTVVEGVRNVTRVMKLLTTGANPVFSLTRNIFRDVPMAFVSSKTTNNPLKFSYDILDGFISVLGNGKLYKSYKALGGGHSSSVAADRNLLAQSKRAITPQDNAKNVPGRILGAIENFNNALETAPRLGEFKRTVKEGGGDQDSKIKGLFEGNDITVNFKRAGTVSRDLDAFFPYFNAAIQGIDKAARIFKDNPVQASVKAASAITVPTIFLYAMNHDNPNYQKLSQYNKDNFYNFPMPDGKFLKIPKPHTIGVAFGSGVERILSQWMDEDPQGFDQFSTTFINQFLPPGVGGAVSGAMDNGIVGAGIGIGQDTIGGPFLDLAANKNFAGAPIVPGNLENVSPKYQYDQNTSSLSKLIGDKTNMSPKQLDHLIKSYTGVLGQLGIPLMSQGATLGETLQKQVTSDPVFSNDIMRDFYDLKEKVDIASADFKQTGIQSKDFDEGRRKVFNMFNDHMGDIRKIMRMVEQNEDLTRQEKKERIRELHIQMTELAQRAIESTK